MLALVGSGVLATMVSAAVGVTSLYLGGVVPITAVPSSALLWWSGDAVGVLTLTPALLMAYTSRRSPRHVGRGRLVEAGLLAGALVLAWLTFIANILGPIVVFPPLVWAAIRFRLAGACLASLATSAVVVGATTRGVGLFASQPPGQDLLLAQGYVAVVVATSLLMAAMTAERERTTDELRLAAAEITRRNDELERERARLDEAQRIAHLGSWQWDIATDSVQWSDEMFRIYGLAPRSVALDYREFLDRIHSEDRAEVDAVVRSACAAAGPFLVEHRIIRPDGQVRTLQARGLAVSDGDAVVRMAGTGLDITERREAERARQAAAADQAARRAAEAAAARLQAMVDGLSAIVWEADARTWEFTFVSDRAAELLGYPVKQWLSDPGFWPRLIHPDDRDEAVRRCAQGTAGGRDYAFSYRAVAADGRVRWLHDVVHVVNDPDGTPRELQGVMIDITAQKRRERASALLAEAGRLLASVRAVEDTLTAVAELAVGELGDLAAVFLRGGDGRFRPVAAAPPAAAAGLLALGPVTISERLEAAHRAGRAVVVPEINDELLRAATADDATAYAALRAIGVRSALIVPLLTGEQVVGCLAIVATETRAPL